MPSDGRPGDVNGRPLRPATPGRLAGLLLAIWPLAVASQGGEESLKAAFLYNFALYTEWPALPARFEVCALGRDSLGVALDQLAAKEVAGRPVQVRRVPGGEIPGDCHLVYLAEAEAHRFGPALAALAGRPVLTVIDATRSGDAPAARAILHLGIDQGRLVFDADQSAARTAGLGLSAKMLRLARRVR